MALALSAPVPNTQQQQLTQLAAQWSPDQRLWASGFLAGMAAAGAPTAAAELNTPAAPAAVVTGTVLYGSQSGNGQAIAETLAAQGAVPGVKLRAVNMADYPAARLAKDNVLLVVVSTHGEGDPPDDAADLYAALADADGPRLEQLQYAVLALGDSSYARFCQTGRDFDERLAARGAQSLLPRVECDLDYHDPAQQWQSSVLEALKPDTPAAEPGFDSLIYAVPDPTTPSVTRSQPFAAQVEVNQRITASGSDQDVRHLELAIDGSGIEYQPGDSLAVVVENPASLVDRALELCGLDSNAQVRIDDDTLALGEALKTRLELTRLTRPVLQRFAELSRSEMLLAALDNPTQLTTTLHDYQVLDLLAQHPVPLEPQGLVDLLNPLAHRAYSIASSQALHPDSVHLTVARLNYSAFGEHHYGAASTALADLSAGDAVRVFPDPNPRFRLPQNPDAPVIMIGPGTGVAPFRAFLQEREALGAAGPNWLLFGHRHFATDFLYQIEWLRWRKSGLLTRLDVAFSRDQAEKRYVQHVMAEQGSTFYDWLEKGASVYVCGDAQYMAPDVDQALHQLVAAHGNLSSEAAAEYVSQLRRDGRYRRDVY